MVTTFEENKNFRENSVGTSKVLVGTFTENLLRSVIDLKPPQQAELIKVTIFEENKNFRENSAGTSKVLVGTFTNKKTLQ